MTHHRQPPLPDPAQPDDPARPLALALALDGDAAIDLLIANTGPGQTVVDFDHDPVLRAAAHTTGRRYRTLPLSLQTRDTPSARVPEASLVVLAWPRPHTPAPTAAAEALVIAADTLLPGGHVAVLLEPTIPQAYTITWTGAILAAAHAAGLDYLQDIICLHTTADPADPAAEEARPTHRHGPAADTTSSGNLIRNQHRVVLVLRTQAGRHA